MIYRDKSGVEYVPVPLPTHEVTDAVAVNARLAARSGARREKPVYTGADGAKLAAQPRSHRRRWTDRQWLAFEEHLRLETDRAGDDPPAGAVGVVQPHDREPA